MKTELRKTLKQTRLNLSSDEQTEHAKKIAQHLTQSDLYKNANTLAAYLAVRGEMDPSYIIKQARVDNKIIYLPVITDNKLLFKRYDKDSALVESNFKTLEPDTDETIDANEIDIILMPLVGFDEDKNRLGMGAGHYDKTLEHCNKPTLIGLAHECQKIESVPTEPHDIPLDFILTETSLR